MRTSPITVRFLVESINQADGEVYLLADGDGYIPEIYVYPDEETGEFKWWDSTIKFIESAFNVSPSWINPLIFSVDLFVDKSILSVGETMPFDSIADSKNFCWKPLVDYPELLERYGDVLWA